MRSGCLSAAVLAGVCGCSFSEAGVSFTDAGVNNNLIDARVIDAVNGGDAPLPDASACPAPLQASISVDGVTTGSPRVHVLVGDTITLSASGSCGQAASITSYEWQLSPTTDTAMPDLTSETISVYPTEATQYTVSLTVRDSQGRSDIVQIIGFEAHGWERIDGLPGNAIHDLAVSSTDLFIAGQNGAFRIDLGAPLGGFVDINGEVSGATIGTNLSSVYWAASANLVWFAAGASGDEVWKVDRTVPFTATAVDYNVGGLGESAVVRDIGGTATGIELATDKGVAETSDNAAFTETFNGNFYAVARGGGQRWAGSNKLYDIDGGGTVLDPFSAGDNKIRTMLVDVANDELWLGTDNNGIARVVNSTGELIVVYKTNNSALPDNHVRAIAIETVGQFVGDVWIATANGVARFKRDRLVWVPMGATHGLDQRTDLDAIAIDENAGRRRIYAGSNNGLVYSRAE